MLLDAGRRSKKEMTPQRIGCLGFLLKEFRVPYLILAFALIFALPLKAAAQTTLNSDVIEPQFANAIELKSYAKRVIADVAACSDSQNGYLSCFANDGPISFQLMERFEPKQGVVGLSFGVSNNGNNRRLHFDEAQFAPAVKKYILPFLESLKLAPQMAEDCMNFAKLAEIHGAKASSKTSDFVLHCSSLDQNDVFGLAYSIIAFEK
jgi:hypothetical protein